MPLTVINTSPQSEDVWGRLRVRVATLTFDSSYDAGGESFVPSDVGLASFLAVVPLPDSNALGGNVVLYDYTARKLRVYRQRDPAAAGGADIPLTEVTAAVNLSTLVVRVLAIGN